MYAKLAFRNVRRSTGDYAVYVMTLILSIALIFAYNSLLFSDAIRSFNKLMRPMMTILVCVTVVVVLILGWLIAYITRFIFEQRSKEFACYMTMGMERRTMSRLFLTEQLLIGGAAGVLGMIAGNLFYLALSQVIFKMFDKTYYMDLSFQLPALGLTILCFVLMFAFSLLRQGRILKKMKVKELMDFGKRNEIVADRGKKGGILLAAGIGLGGLICLYLSLTVRLELLGPFGNLGMMAAGIAMQVIGLMMFYERLAYRIQKSYQKNAKRRLHHLNLFFCRQLTARLKTNGRQMGVVSVLLLLTLLGLGGAAFMSNAYKDNLANQAPFDVEVCRYYGSLETEQCREFTAARSRIKKDYAYDIYGLDSKTIAAALNRIQEEIPENITEGFVDDSDYDYGIKLKDYNSLREMLGREPVTLGENEYAVQTEVDSYASKYLRKQFELKTNGAVYKLKDVYTGPFAQTMINETAIETKSLIILPDQAFEGMTPSRGCYMAIVDDREKTGYQDELQKQLDDSYEKDGPDFSVVYTYAGAKDDLQAIYMMTAFICCYGAFICIFICATILAVQLLNMSKKYRYQYDQLRRMGTTCGDIRKLVFRQTAVYFLVPLILPCIFVIFYMLGIGAVLPVRRGMLLLSFCGAAGIFLAVYGCYLVLTYLQYQKNVLKGVKHSKIIEELVNGL